MKIKLKCGDVYDTEALPTIQNLSEEGMKEVLEMFRNDNIKNPSKD